MRHAFLHGEYELTIDDKNRFLIPADIRKMMDPERDGEAFFLVIGSDRRPWLYPEQYYKSLVDQVQSDLTPGRDRLATDRRMFGTASRLEWDKQGRVLIPEKTRAWTSLQKEVTLVGVRDHLEIWNRSDWDAELHRLFANPA